MLSIVKISSGLILATIALLNKMKKSPYIVFFLWLILALNTHAQNNASDLSDTRKVTEVEKKFIKFYFEAERHKLLEEYEQAVENYQKCISIFPEDASPYYQIGKINLYVFNELSAAEYYINEAIGLSPENEWCYYDLITIYGAQNNIKEIQKVYDKLIKLNPDNQRYYFESIRMLIELKDYRAAMRAIKKTDKKFGTSNESLLFKKDIYIQQNNFKEAENIGKKLIERSPEFYSVLAETYMYFSDYEKAIITYNKLLEFFPNSPVAIIALHTIYSNKKDTKKEEGLLFKIASNELVSVETKKEIFYNKLINNEFSKYQSFKTIIESAVFLHPEEPLFHLILGDICSKEENYQQAISYYKSSLYSGFIKDDYIYNKLVQMYWQQEKTEEALKTAEEAIERFPFSSEFYYYKGLALSTQEKYSACIETLLKGQEFVFDNDLLKSDFYSMMGDVYHKMNKHTESDEGYTNALKYNPQNTMVLNNYSYYLSQRGEELARAKKMIVKCLELTANEPNASYIDTYAWVLYKLGEYELARAQIEQAVSLKNNSPVILDHYGDILYKLGLEKEAVKYWEKAYKLDPNNLKLIEKINRHSK